VQLEIEEGQAPWGQQGEVADQGVAQQRVVVQDTHGGERRQGEKGDPELVVEPGIGWRRGAWEGTRGRDAFPEGTHH
jgi:hypothetical protein